MNSKVFGWVGIGALMVACFLVGWVVATNTTLVYAQPAGDVKEPKWLHGMNLKSRTSAQTEFKDAKKYGIEVFRDENNGNLIYISETGSIAVVSEKK